MQVVQHWKGLHKDHQQLSLQCARGEFAARSGHTHTRNVSKCLAAQSSLGSHEIPQYIPTYLRTSSPAYFGLLAEMVMMLFKAHSRGLGEIEVQGACPSMFPFSSSQIVRALQRQHFQPRVIELRPNDSEEDRHRASGGLQLVAIRIVIRRSNTAPPSLTASPLCQSMMMHPYGLHLGATWLMCALLREITGDAKNELPQSALLSPLH